MRTLIIHNNLSGFGSDAIFEFERALIDPGDEVVMRSIPHDFDFDTLIADATDFDLIVLSGGDGTVAQLLYRLKNLHNNICVFPSGTANLLCLNLKNAAEPVALARSCKRGHVVKTDLGELTWQDKTQDGQPLKTAGFALMAGLGYDALLMQTASPHKQTKGERAYFAAALENTHPQVSQFTIQVDGQTWQRSGIACLVANNATIQADIEIVPNCLMNDGLLDVIVLETQDAYHLLRPILGGLFDKTGRQGRPYIEHFTGKEISITSSLPLPMQIDGDVVGSAVTHFDAHVLPLVNRLIVDETSPYYKSLEKI